MKHNPLKALSPNCTIKAVNDQESGAYAKLRLKLSKEEIDVINNGGYESVGDWRKIKM